MAENFDNQTYNIGHTEPPKSRSGLIAVLLIVIIFLGGIVSILGLLNISLFQQLLSKNKKQEALAVVVPDQEHMDSALEVTYGEETVILEYSPQSLDYYPQNGGRSLQEIYKNTVRSLVTVETGGENGTGVIITSDGYILTNNYLISGMEKVNVHLSNGQKLAATIVGRDSFSDLAVLKVHAEDLHPVSFGDSTALRVGDVVVSMGSFNGNGMMADGIVSAVHENINAGGSSMTLLQTSATLNEEQVGGILINCYGQVVGMNTHCAEHMMALTPGENISFSLDSATIKNITDQLINYGFVEDRIHLGIHGQEIDEFYQQYYDIPRGIFITAIEEESALFIRGVRQGDILINFADTPIFSFDILNSLLASLEQGQEVTAVVYRDGTQHQIKVTIGEQS